MEVAKKLNILTEEDLLAALGYGGVVIHGIMTKLIEPHKKEIKQNTPPDVSKMLSELKHPQQNGQKSKSSHGVLVEGESGLMVHLPVAAIQSRAIRLRAISLVAAVVGASFGLSEYP